MMDKLISQQAAIDTIKKRLFETAFNNVGIKQNVDETLLDVAENRLENWFNELPPAQTDIIHCKDCKHSRFFDPCFYCYEMGGEIIVPENGFCFKAERREDEAD